MRLPFCFWICGAGAGNKEQEAPQPEIPQDTITQESPNQQNNVTIYADICGCVKNPGVYELAEGTRIFQLIEEAGGLTDDADIAGLNRAEVVTDGQKIIIPAIGEDTGTAEGTSGAYTDAGGRININKADAKQLQEIPGVGPATADKIIQYRESHGKFSAVDDIKNVSGIGDKTFERMKEYITAG